MSYIGRGLQSGAFRQLDDISSGFDGSDTTHTMQVNSTNVTVGDVNQILLSLGGVIQKPGTDFTVSGSTLTFTTAPAANTSFFAILLGSDNGGTVTPTDGSVTTAKIVDANVTKAKLADSIDVFAGTALSAADLGVGVHIKSADSSASASVHADELVIENSANAGLSVLSGASNSGSIFFGDSGDNDIGYIQYEHSTTNSLYFGTNAGTRMIIDSTGAVTKPNQPAFLVSPADASAQNNISHQTVITFPDEIFDQNADFASNTFTAPVTGRYQLNASLRIGGLDTDATYHFLQIETSNRNYQWIIDPRAFDADPVYWPATWSALADMDANDTAFIKYYQSGGADQLDIETGGSFFSGFLAC